MRTRLGAPRAGFASPRGLDRHAIRWVPEQSPCISHPRRISPPLDRACAWSANLWKWCEAIWRGSGVVAEEVLRPAGTRVARMVAWWESDWGWRDAASRHPQSLSSRATFLATRVPAGRRTFSATTPDPRHIASHHFHAFADHFARARSTDRQTRRCRAVFNETIQILGFER